MVRKSLLLAVLCAGALTVYGALQPTPKDSAKPPPAESTKNVPVRLVPFDAPAEVTPEPNATEAPAPFPDRGKFMVEEPVKKALAPPRPISRRTPKHEATKPGLVNWHNSTAAAVAAARENGKPVLVFQLLGRLDDRFC